MAESSKSLADIMDIALPAGAMVLSALDPRLGQGVAMAANIANSRSRAKASRADAARQDELLKLSQAENQRAEAQEGRLSSIFQSQEPARKAQTAADLTLSQVLNPGTLQGPTFGSGTLDTQPGAMADRQAASMAQFLEQPGSREVMAAGSEPFQRASATSLATGAQDLQSKAQTSDEEKIRQSWQRLDLDEQQYALNAQKATLDARKQKFDEGKLTWMDAGKVYGKDGKATSHYVAFDPQTKAPVAQWIGAESESPPSDLMVQMNEAGLSAKDKTAVQQNDIALNLMKKLEGKGGRQITLDAKGQTMTFVEGSAGMLKNIQDKGARKELAEQSAALFQYEKGLQDFNELTLGSPDTYQGFVGFADRILQGLGGQAGEVQRSLKQRIEEQTGTPEVKVLVTDSKGQVVTDKNGNPKEKVLSYSEWFKPDYTKRELAVGVLAFQRAAAIAGQTGRALSDRDLNIMREGLLGNDRNQQIAIAEQLQTELQIRKEGFEHQKSLLETDPADAQRSLPIEVPFLQQYQQQPQAQQPAPVQAAPQAPASTDVPPPEVIEEMARQTGESVEQIKATFGIK